VFPLRYRTSASLFDFRYAEHHDWFGKYQLCEHTSCAIFETKNQNSRMATKTCFGSFLPKHVLVAKSFGHSTISTNSYSSNCQNMFWLPLFFFGYQNRFWQSAANSKMQ